MGLNRAWSFRVEVLFFVVLLGALRGLDVLRRLVAMLWGIHSLEDLSRDALGWDLGFGVWGLGFGRQGRQGLGFRV